MMKRAQFCLPENYSLSLRVRRSCLIVAQSAQDVSLRWGPYLALARAGSLMNELEADILNQRLWYEENKDKSLSELDL
jgi:hypothetical protein